MALLLLMLVIAAIVVAMIGFPWVCCRVWLYMTLGQPIIWQSAPQLPRVQEPTVLVSSTALSWLDVLAVWQVYRGPITWVTQQVLPGWWVRYFFSRFKIQLVEHVVPTAQGVMMMSLQQWRASKVQSTLPLWALCVCGRSVVAPTREQVVPTRKMVAFAPLDMALTPESLALFEAQVWHHYTGRQPGIVAQWLRHARHRPRQLAIADSSGKQLNMRRSIVGVMALNRVLTPLLCKADKVGICLPPGLGGCLALLSVLAQGKVMVGINYTASHYAMRASIDASSLEHVITSRLFLIKLKQRGIDLTAVFEGVQIHYLEDLHKQIFKPRLIAMALLVRLLPRYWLERIMVRPVSQQQPAAILFSSGSEGKPKGVVLTHGNLIGNVCQMSEVIEAQRRDVMVAILPIFHAFGLTVNTLLPLMYGLTLVCHPDPRDAGGIGTLVAQYQGTILCGTSTFFRLYAKSRHIQPEQFASLRYIVAGAEKLLPEVRLLFEEKFKRPLYEGYGTTELAPVVSVNCPDLPERIRHCIGSVGLPIPGCVVRILDPKTTAPLPQGSAGMIAVAGVNVMQGYLNDTQKTQAVMIKADGLRWYLTGDKGQLNPDGFIRVLDRYSRFAKLGGEMVSLGAVEQEVAKVLDQPEVEVIAVALADVKKGEQIVLLAAGDTLNIAALEQAVKASSMNNLMKPQRYYQVVSIPKLGSGKTDFAAVKVLAQSLVKEGFCTTDINDKVLR